MEKKTIYIDGMHCENCKMRVEKKLSNIEGVNKVDVRLNEKKAVIEAEKPIENTIIEEAIDELGFEVKEIQTK